MLPTPGPGTADISSGAPQGRYLFRDLAAGTSTISVQNDAQTLTCAVRLGSLPEDLAGMDFQIGNSGPREVSAPTVLPRKPQTLLPGLRTAPQPTCVGRRGAYPALLARSPVHSSAITIEFAGFLGSYLTPT